MGYLADTTTMVGAQLRYRRGSLLLVIALQSAALIAMQLTDPRPEMYSRVAAALSVVLGGAVCVFAWGVDAAERRVRLLAMLPTSRLAISTSRLFAVALMQAAISFSAWLVCLPLAFRHDMAGSIGTLVASGAVWIVALVYSSYFFEEINVALSRSKILLWIGNGAALALIFGLMFIPEGDFFELAFQPRYLTIAGGMILVFGVGSALLFQWRQSFDVGVSPWHGFPVDWSEEAD